MNPINGGGGGIPVDNTENGEAKYLQDGQPTTHLPNAN